MRSKQRISDVNMENTANKGMNSCEYITEIRTSCRFRNSMNQPVNRPNAKGIGPIYWLFGTIDNSESVKEKTLYSIKIFIKIVEIYLVEWHFNP